jgi:SAM-dependent methyltransferase
MHPASTILDIGAGTGAFAIPLAELGYSVIALDPSAYHLGILKQKAEGKGLINIRYHEDLWSDQSSALIGEVDYALSAYSMIDPDLEGFIQRMIDTTRRGFFLIYRAGEPDPVDRYVFGDRPRAGYRYITRALDRLGPSYRVDYFKRAYSLPIPIYLRRYQESDKKSEDILAFLQDHGRLNGDSTVSCEVTDAMIAVLKDIDPVDSTVPEQ